MGECSASEVIKHCWTVSKRRLYVVNWNGVKYTGWSKSLCAPDDYNIQSYK